MFKLFFDFFLSLFLIIFLSPIFILLSILIFFYDGLPIFYIQQRAGKHGKPFNLYKFRSMSLRKVLKNNDRLRITHLGRFLRFSKLDELPQLFNILKQDMSFVGPRPLLVEYNKLYSYQQKKRLLVLPGLTGWSQIHEVKNMTWEKRINYDIWYVKNKSHKLDILILIKTIFFLFKIIFLKKNKVILISKKFNGK